MNKLLSLLLVSMILVCSSCIKEDPDIYDPEEVAFSTLVDGPVGVELDPFGCAPLSALVQISTFDKTNVEVKVLGDIEMSHQTLGEAKNQEVSVTGLYPDVTNDLVVKVTNTLGKYAYDTIQIATEALPAFFPDIEIPVADPSLMEEGLTLAMFSIGVGGAFHSYPFMIDSNGDVRWYFDLSSFGFIASPGEPLENGNLLFGSRDTLAEFDFLGDRTAEWVLDGYHQHHDIIEKPNGNLVVAVLKEGIGTSDDHIIELDRNSGAIVNEWDMRQILDMDRFDLTENAYDWFHMNSFWYDESDQGLIVSGRNQCIVKVTPENEVQWILAPHKGWGKAGIDGDGFETSQYLLTAIDPEGNPYDQSVQDGLSEPDDFSWVWGQHAPMLLPNGNLFVYDNGFNRLFTGETLYSHGVEYVVDEENMTVQQVWEYGKDRGDDFYSMIISDVDYHPETGNRMITSGWCTVNGTHAIIAEVTYPGKEVVFEARLTFKDISGSGEMGWGEFDICYRAERIRVD